MLSTELIGVCEAAEMLGISRQGLHERIRRGLINPTGRIGKRRTMVFERADIEKIAASEAVA